MANSTITLQQLVDDAQSWGDLAPALPTGGYSVTPALSMANDVMVAMLQGSAQGAPFNWKFNRQNVIPFTTISWQQDYFIPGLVNLGWIESSWCSNINSTQIPKQIVHMEVHRDLLVEYLQTANPMKICWMNNSTLQTGTWGVHPFGPTAGNPAGETVQFGPNLNGLQNPGPGVIYTNPVGQIQSPINATTGIKDSFGNLWVLTTFGTCGNTNPFLTNLNPVFPTYANPNVVATTVTDGTVVWTAVNPDGQGFRLDPLPPQTGVVWQIQVVAQKRVPTFTKLSQTLEPVPDDYATYFKQGFFAQCYRRNPDAKVRARFKDEWAIWMDNLDKAVRQGSKEMDDFGFYPSQSIMDSGIGVYVGPAYPWAGGGWGI